MHTPVPTSLFQGRFRGQGEEWAIAALAKESDAIVKVDPFVKEIMVVAEEGQIGKKLSTIIRLINTSRRIWSYAIVYSIDIR